MKPITNGKKILLFIIFIIIIILSISTFIYGCINREFNYISISLMMITPSIIGLILLRKSSKFNSL